MIGQISLSLPQKLYASPSNVGTGDGIQVYGSLILSKMKHACQAPAHLNKQRAGSVAYAGACRYAQEQYINGDDFAPEYLKMSQAERERKEKGEGNE